MLSLGWFHFLIVVYIKVRKRWKWNDYFRNIAQNTSTFPPHESFLREPAVRRAAGGHRLASLHTIHKSRCKTRPTNPETLSSSSSSSPPSCRYHRRTRQHPPFSYAGKAFNTTHWRKLHMLMMSRSSTNRERPQLRRRRSQESDNPLDVLFRPDTSAGTDTQSVGGEPCLSLASLRQHSLNRYVFTVFWLRCRPSVSLFTCDGAFSTGRFNYQGHIKVAVIYWNPTETFVSKR